MLTGIWIDDDEVKKRFDRLQIVLSAREKKRITQTKTLKFPMDFYNKNS